MSKKGTESSVYGGKIFPRTQRIDVGNSGTTLRIATAIAALGNHKITIDGDAQTQRRPLKPLLTSLEELGATIKPTRNKQLSAPVTICGPLQGGNTNITCQTSQYLTALLLVTPLLSQQTTIIVTKLNEKPYVDMTLAWLKRQDIAYEQQGYERFTINGKQSYQHFEHRIEGDYSSATFLLAAAGLVGTRITISDLPATSNQGDIAIIEVLRHMGIPIHRNGDTLLVERHRNEKRGLLPVLQAIDCNLNAMPDAVPALMAVTCYAQGTSHFRDIAHARIKESDRINIMTKELRKMGADIITYPDQVTVHGNREKMHGAILNSHNDHRVAMALAVAALAARGASLLKNSSCVAVTYPDFFEIIESITLKGSIRYE